ncbi:MAG: hypothetical protein AAF553_08800 [Pseudomonadota bacterium]
MTLSFLTLLATLQSVPDADSVTMPFFPLMVVRCQTKRALEDSVFDATQAMVLMPSPWKITSDEKQLKFHHGLIAFAGARTSYQIRQPEIFQEDMDNRESRFGDLKARQADDDIPTTFSLDGFEYEIQATTGFPIVKRIDGKSFTIDRKAMIEVKIEKVTDRMVRDEPVWAGQCHMTDIREVMSS